MFKSKKGFTLMELSVVVAVTAVVVTMVCGFILTYQNQSLKVVKSSDAVLDINKFKGAVDEWISTYDSKKYNYNLQDTNVQNQTAAKQIIAENATTLKVDNFRLQFDTTDKKLYVKTNNTVNKTFEFETISNCAFTKNHDMVYCTLTCNGKQVKLIFNIFSTTKRDRFSTKSGVN